MIDKGHSVSVSNLKAAIQLPKPIVLVVRVLDFQFQAESIRHKHFWSHSIYTDCKC